MADKELLRKTMKNLLLHEARKQSGPPPQIRFDKPTHVFRHAPLTSPDSCATLFAYLPFGTEADPRIAIQTVLSRGIPVLAPRITGELLQFHQISSLSGPFEQNRWGISEPPSSNSCYFSPDPSAQTHWPQAPLLVLVPALAFDLAGGRLGRGGGYYDRFLAELLSRYADHREDITLAGVGFSQQIIDRVPREKHDISVDCLYTDV